ncbi:MAG: hypothetical protein ACE5I7_07480 [Candidatus Binatia bacterium]
MKTLTVRLPDKLATDIAAESRAAGLSKSDVVRRRLEARAHHAAGEPPSFYDLAADLIGSGGGDRLPTDLSARKKRYLQEWGYGTQRRRR